jgi:hypothetical protein
MPGTSAAPQIVFRGLVSADAAAAPTDAFCRANFFAACYSPQEIRTAYGLNGLIDAGMVGTGQTIIVIESYGSPTIAADLSTFDAGYGLPDPPSLTVLAPLGTVPWNPALYPDQPNWAGETTLDVEWAHAMAPGAAIVVLTSPVDETEGVQGLPEFLALEKYALDHHLGKIISQSWAATENTLFFDAAGPQGPQVIADYSAFYARALLGQVTVLASAGDQGSSNVENNLVTFYIVSHGKLSSLLTACDRCRRHGSVCGYIRELPVGDRLERRWVLCRWRRHQSGISGASLSAAVAAQDGQGTARRHARPARRVLQCGCLQRIYLDIRELSWCVRRTRLLRHWWHERRLAAVGRRCRRPQPVRWQAARIPQSSAVRARRCRSVRPYRPRHNGRQ